METDKLLESKEPALESLEDVVSHLLEEARMVLPGIQALLGFQLVAVFNQSFKDNLNPLEQYTHLAAICCSMISICLLMTPASLHRLTQPDNISKEFARFSSKLLAVALVPLCLSFSMDFFVVSRLITENYELAYILTFLVLNLFLYFWFIMPLTCKKNFQ